MEIYLIYIGKSAIAAGAFYLFFLLLFQNKKHFTFNRYYLPVSLLLSFIIPLITFTSVKYIEPLTATEISGFAFLPEVSGITVQPALVIEWYHYLFGLYLLGAAGFLFHLLLGHFKAIFIVKSSRVQQIFERWINITKKDVHPFSFFNKIVLSENTLDHPSLEMIVNHEHIHVKEKHTLDILFTEILFLAQWFNPFAWLIKDAIKNNLEYKTDDQIAKTYNPKAYQMAMLTLADKEGVAPFLTALNGSQLKNRIIMMKKKTENKYVFLKQLLVLPLLAILVMGLSNKEIKTEIIQAEIETEIANLENAKNEKVTNQIEAEEDTLIAVVLSEVSNQVDKQMSLYVQYLGSEKAVEKYFKKPIDKIKAEMQEGIQDNLLNQKIGNAQLNTIQDIKKVTIKGNVTDEKGIFLSGAIILVKGESTGTITDSSGYYQIKLDAEDQTLVFILAGYEKQEIEVGEKTEINVKLKSDPKAEEINVSPKQSQKLKAEQIKKYGSEVFYKVEEMPEFPGGENALKKWIEESTNYPEIALENGIQGKVYVTFIIDKKGKVNDPVISRGVDPSIDKEALRVANTLPAWKPGKQRGKAVNVSYTIPVDFQLTVEQIRKYSKVGLDGKRLKRGSVATVKGKITNEQGEPIPGANILLKRKTIGTISDINGEYTLGMNDKNETLIFSFLGYRVQEIPVNGKSEINVQLIADKNANGQITVVGYATKEAAENGAKIQLETNSGNQPLYVVDGIPVDKIDHISPDDIESISILKDKSATSLYGEKGKNGVVIITSKAAAAKTSFAKAKEMEFETQMNPTSTISLSEEKVIVNIDKNTNQPLYVVNGEIVKSIDELAPDEIQSISVIKDKSATEKYGEKGKNGVLQIFTKDYKLNSQIELRKFISKEIRYPEKARFGKEGMAQLFIQIDKAGEVTKVLEQSTGNELFLDEVIVVAYKPDPAEVVVKSTFDDLSTVFSEETKRVIDRFPIINIPEYKGKTVGITIKFVLQ